jgi:hypothetical protein
MPPESAESKTSYPAMAPVDINSMFDFNSLISQNQNQNQNQNQELTKEDEEFLLAAMGEGLNIQTDFENLLYPR